MITELLTRMRFLLFRKRSSEVDDELQFHIEHSIEQKIAAGLSPSEARRQALIEFGGIQRTREQVAHQRPGHLLSNIAADIRYAARVLRKSPGFTLVTLLTLALCIGANTLVFGLLNQLVLRPLNIPQGDRFFQVNNREGNPSMSYPDYLDLRARNHSFTGLALYEITTAGLDSDGTPIPIWLYTASGNYFDVVGVHPYLGRFFHQSDIHGLSTAPYVVLSYDFWHSHFQSDRTVVGRVVQINKFNYTVLGVAPQGFRGTELFYAPALWVPTVDEEQIEGYSMLNQRGARGLWIAGHLKPGVTPAQAAADLNTIGAWLSKTYPKDDDGIGFSVGKPGLAGDLLGKPVRAFIAGLMLLAALILLAACANLGGLFAARASDRVREVSLRLALGSSRIRIARRLLTEAVIVSLAGGVLGLAGSFVLMRAISAWHPIPGMPISLDLHIDGRTCAAALLLALVSGLLFGIVPLRQVFRTDPYQGIRNGAATLARFRRFSFRDLLLAAQIAVCAVLVTASLVAVRGMLRSLHSNLGFNPQNVVQVSTDLDMSGYKGDATAAMQRRMMDTVAQLSGVTSVAYADRIPLNLGWSNTAIFRDTTTDYRMSNTAAYAMQYNVSPGFFQTVQTPILQGRAFTWNEKTGTPPVAVINRELSHILFGANINPVGRYFRAYSGKRIQIIGLAENGKYKTLSEDPQPAAFFPILQNPTSSTWLVVRSNREPGDLIPALDQTLHGLDPSLPLTIHTWQSELGSALLAARAASIALGVLGSLGALLAITGIFGMAAYSVSKRLREIGIRIALGAQRTTVLSAALGRVFRLLLIGSVVGIILGIAATKLLAYIVYQATPRDPLVLIGVIVTMLVLGLVAAWIPAQRALAADPLALLREE
ncbi:MAG TPA: ABC transporter permease [Terracidiphilus sp.]|nr:ABC transporter permease [Terracidiphilus sp.]